MRLSEDLERCGRLNSAFEQYRNTRNVLINEVISMGYPEFVDDGSGIKTAAVGMTEDNRLKYFWNRAFFDRLGVDAIAYVAAHETLHVLLKHPTRRGDRDAKRWNIACDIVVNALLDCRYTFVPTGKDLRRRVRASRYGWTYDYEALEETTEAIYDALPPNPKPGPLYHPGTGEIIDLGPEDGETMDSHDMWDTITDEQIEHLKAKIDKPGENWGHGSDVELERLKSNLIKPFNWQRMTANRLASIRKPSDGDNWARCHRRIYDSYPDILMPGEHEGEKLTLEILLSIDASGSMSTNMIEDMVAIVGSLPKDEYVVHFTWFDDGVYEAYDLATAIGRGGTSFQSIEDVANGTAPIVQQNGELKYLTKYPDCVIVMTDGYAPAPSVKHPNRWCWIVAEKGSADAPRKVVGSTVWKL